MALPDRDGPLPLYHQVKSLILKEIETARWKTGDRLPPEGALSERFGVSKITVRHALGDLARLGYVSREQGRGTFVRRPPVVQGPRALTSFTDEMRRRGVAASSRVLEHEVTGASGAVAEALGLAIGDPVFRLHRLRLADGEPMGLQTAFVPFGLVPGIDEVDFAASSLYEVLDVRYHLQPDRARETHAATTIAAEDAKMLGVVPGSPGLWAERVSFLADGRPLEAVYSVMRGDRYSVVLDLVRQHAGLER